MARRATKSEPKAAAPPVAVLTQNEAISSFREHAKGFNKQSIILACSAAVCLIVGANSGPQSTDQEGMIHKLKKEVASAGLSESQTAKYIGLARSLVNHLMFRFKLGGPIHEVLQAVTADDANTALLAYLDTVKVRTLEDLTVVYNKYKRTKKKAKGALAPAKAKSGEHEGARPAMNGGKQGEIVVADGTGNALDLYAVATVKLVAMSVSSGHTAVDIAAAAIDMITDAGDIAHILEMASGRSHLLLQAPSARAVA